MSLSTKKVVESENIVNDWVQFIMRHFICSVEWMFFCLQLWTGTAAWKRVLSSLSSSSFSSFPSLILTQSYTFRIFLYSSIFFPSDINATVWISRSVFQDHIFFSLDVDFFLRTNSLCNSKADECYYHYVCAAVCLLVFYH